jgi:hypothetical protein
MQEMTRIAKGHQNGNSVSLLRASVSIIFSWITILMVN